jgi:hypothetical protein
MVPPERRKEASVMQQSHLNDPPKPGDLSPPCAVCGMPMFLSRIEPADQADYDQRTFECLTCKRSQTVTVKNK